MLKAFSAFLTMFWVLGQVVHLGRFIHVFALVAVAFFVVDLILRTPTTRSDFSRTRDEFTL